MPKRKTPKTHGSVVNVPVYVMCNQLPREGNGE